MDFSPVLGTTPSGDKNPVSTALYVVLISLENIRAFENVGEKEMSVFRIFILLNVQMFYPFVVLLDAAQKNNYATTI